MVSVKTVPLQQTTRKPCVEKAKEAFCNKMQTAKTFVIKAGTKTGSLLGVVRNNISFIHKVWKVIAFSSTIFNAILKRESPSALSSKLETAIDYAEMAQILDDTDVLFSHRIVRNEDKKPRLDNEKHAIRKTKFQQMWYDYKKEEPIKLPFMGIFRTSLIAADVGGIFLWCSDRGVFDLGDWSTRITEKISGFAHISRIGLGNIVRGVVGVAFTFLAADAIKRLVTRPDADTPQKKITTERTQAFLDLAWAVTEVAFKVFALAGVATIIGGALGLVALCGLGAIASSVGIASGLYKYITSKEDDDVKNKNRVQAKKEAIEAHNQRMFDQAALRTVAA